MMWNMAGTHCVSMHWQYAAADPDTVAGATYFTELETRLKAESKYVKSVDKANDAYTGLQVRECELQYNPVNGFSFVDLVHVWDSPRNRFLRAWNLTATIEAGAADDPCSGYGNSTA